jgi:hypothetical protein
LIRRAGREPMYYSIRSILSVVVVLVALAAPLDAGAEQPTFVIILDETIEGETPTVPEAQGIVENGLINKGYIVVDR